MRDDAIWGMVTPLLARAEREVDVFMARRPVGVERVDLVQVCALALYQAARRYDPNSGSSLWSFARLRVQGAMRDAHYRSRGWRRHWGRYRPHRSDRSRRWGDHLTQETAADRWVVLQESVRHEWQRAREETAGPTPEEATLRKASATALSACLHELAPEERTLLVEVYANDKSLGEVAHEMGCHRSSVSRQHASLLRFLRTRLTEVEKQACVPEAPDVKRGRAHCRARRRRWNVVTRGAESVERGTLR